MENVGNKNQQSGVDKETEEGEDMTKCEKCCSLNNGCCIKCSAESASIGRRGDHMYYTTLESKDIEKRYTCEECGSTFKRWSLLQAHKRKHSDIPPFSCCDCGKQLESKDDWVDHREVGCSSANVHSFPRTNHNVLLNGKRQGSRRGKSFKCALCTKSFKSLGSKNDHERNVHNPVRCYSCNECGKSFYKKYNLNIHKETHRDDRSHVCKMCGKKFKTTQGLRMHMESHSNERPFMCEICGKIFKTRAVLESHTAIHTGETKYSCSVCGKAYRYRASLFIHMRTHSGYRPYSCTECDASFMVKSHLTEHMRSHTGEHPFVCKFCSASFTRAISLKKHLKSHVKAGCNVNIDAAMYHAKVQAFVKPRKPYTSLTEPNTTSAIPKLTHIMQDNVLLNAKERIELFVDQPSNEKELTVIKVSCLDETGLCAFDIVQTSSDYDLLCKSGTSDLIDHQTSHSTKEKKLCMEKIQVISSSMNGRMDKDVRTVTSPATGNAQNTVNGEKIEESGLPSCLTQEDSIHIKKEEEEIAKDWLDSQEVIADAVLELSVNNNDRESSVHYNLSETDHQKVIVTEVIASENSKISTQLEQSNNYNERKEAGVKSAVVSKSGPIDVTFESLELKEVLLQKCSYCDKVYVCKEFVEGNEVCQDCKSLKHLKAVENSKSSAHLQSHDIPDDRTPFRNKLVSRDSDPYHCDICRASFTFRSDLRKHVKQHSSRYPHICKKCGESFQQEIFLSKHHCGIPIIDADVISNRCVSKTIDRSLEYECNKCKKIFPKKFILKVHYRKHTGVKPFKCKMCPKRFISATHRKVHMRCHTGELPYECRDCGKYFRKKSDLAGHHKTCENQENQRMNCNLQGFGISIKEEPIGEDVEEMLEGNRNKGTLIEGIKIEDPSDESSLKQELVEEEEIIQSSHSRSLKCRYCGRTFKFHSVLQAHERSHTGEKPFSCSVCNKAFSKKSNMEVHMRIHTGERPFLCDYCGKYFAYKYSLEAHKRLHTKERPFTCSICGKSFRHEASRHVHMKRHFGDRAFKCDLCPKAFVAKVDLEGHRRTHTGEKPFQCELCNRSFKFRHHLTEHLRYHTGEKPYKCYYCDMTFARAGTRKTHMKKHASIIK